MDTMVEEGLILPVPADDNVTVGIVVLAVLAAWHCHARFSCCLWRIWRDNLVRGIHPVPWKIQASLLILENRTVPSNLVEGRQSYNYSLQLIKC